MASNSPLNSYIIGLDVGDKRIGVAISGTIARLPRPLSHIENGPEAIKQIMDIINQENIAQIIVGLPRNQEGKETGQSQKTREFAAELEGHTGCPIEFADESLSTIRAENELKNNNNPGVSADSLAACYILEEFFSNHGAPK